MDPRRQHLGTLAAALTLAVILLTPCTTKGQGGPPPPPTSPSEHKEITLEERADIFMARKNYADAADYYYRALKRGSFQDAALWNKLGIALQQENKFRSAREAYQKAVHADPSFAEAWNNLGTVYFMANKYHKSVPYYRRAIAIKNDSAAFHLNLGTSYYHLKKYQQAVEEYRTALGIDPKVVLQQSALGTTIHAGGTDPGFYFYMAKAYASTGNAEQAVRYLRRALEDGYVTAGQVGDDPDFKKISQDAAYVELLRTPPVALKN
jgi:tetratricopeptide (TPR) repeat protein